MRLHGMPTLGAAGRCMRWLFIAVLAACLMSCSESGLVDGVDGPVLTSPQPDGSFGGMNGIVSGTVVFDESAGCLYLEHHRVKDRSPVVWPAGASWQADPPAVKIHGQLIEPGMYVEGGGGYLRYDVIKVLAGDAVADAAQACNSHAYPTDSSISIGFFNVGSEVDVVP